MQGSDAPRYSPRVRCAGRASCSACTKTCRLTKTAVAQCNTPSDRHFQEQTRAGSPQNPISSCKQAGSANHRRQQQLIDM